MMHRLIYGFVIVCTLALADSAPKVFTKCTACHGEKGQQVAPGSKGNITIAGLSRAKLIAYLRGYRAGFTDNGGAKSIMYIQAQNLSDADIRDLAEYISSLPKAPSHNANNQP